MVMILRIPAPRWHGGGDPDKAANCFSFPVRRDYDPWFGVGVEGDSDEALKICNGTDSGRVCPLRHECLIFALTNNESDGIWGGMYEDDRTILRRFTPRGDWKWHEPSPREDPSQTETE